MTTTPTTSTLHPCFHKFLSTSLKLRAAIEPSYGSTAADRASRLLLKITSGPDFRNYQHPEDDVRFQAAVEELCSELIAEARAGVDRTSLRSQVHRRLDEARERVAGIQMAPIHQSEVKAFADAADRPVWPFRMTYDETRTVACFQMDGRTVTVDAEFVETLKVLWPFEHKDGQLKKRVQQLGWRRLMVLGENWRPLSHFVLHKRYARLNDADLRNAVRFQNGDKLDLREANVELTWDRDSKNKMNEQARFHPIPEDANDVRQNELIEGFVQTGVEPEKAEIEPWRIFRSKRLKNAYGVRGKVSNSERLDKMNVTADGNVARPTPRPENYDQKKYSTVEPQLNITGAFRTWTGRVQRLWCQTCQELKEVIGKNDDAYQLECLHHRPLDVEKGEQSCQ